MVTILIIITSIFTLILACFLLIYYRTLLYIQELTKLEKKLSIELLELKILTIENEIQSNKNRVRVFDN